MMRSGSTGGCVILIIASVLASPPARAAAPAATTLAAPDSAVTVATATPFAAPDSVATARAAIAFPLAPVRRWQVGLLRADRLQHASLAMTLGLAAGLITRSPRIAGYGSLSLGLVKELWDMTGSSGFDAVDLVADAAGAGVAVIGTRAVIK